MHNNREALKWLAAYSLKQQVGASQLHSRMACATCQQSAAIPWLPCTRITRLLLVQDYRQAEEHYRQLERLDGAEARWPAMVAACLRSQGLTGQVRPPAPGLACMHLH